MRDATATRPGREKLVDILAPTWYDYRMKNNINRCFDRVYDRAVTLVALSGRFVNRFDLPEKNTDLPEDEQHLDLVRRWEEDQHGTR